MQINLFEVSEGYKRLDKMGDPLEKISKNVKWEGLKEVLKPITFDQGKKGGRPAWDAMIIIKSLLLQSLYNIADGACEYQINDRMSFKRFIGLDIAQKAPDEKTLWLYRERLKHKGLEAKIFQWFEDQVNSAGFTAKKGQIIDASFVQTPKPSGKHKKQLEEEIVLTQAQKAQIDRESTFTKKRNQHYHGYKNHIQIDNKYKLIRKHAVSTASTHDSQLLEALLDEKENTHQEVWADSAYYSASSEELLKEKGLNSHIHQRAYRSKPLSKEQHIRNTIKSKTRVRVEHIFGHMVTSMGGVSIQTIGLARARVKISLKNLAYNMQRFCFLKTKTRAFC
jgi:transposase, IS5 family